MINVSVSKMWFLIGFSLLSLNMCFCDSSIYFCADMQPQPHVDIEQLMGMWYGIEIISHRVEDEHGTVDGNACPILYFSEDKTPPATLSPLHKDYNYQQNYGSGYGGYQDRNNYENQGTLDEDTYLQSTQSTNTYNRNTQNDRDMYDRTNYQNRRYGTNDLARQKYNEEVKRLRLLWDENGSYTEYTMRYNITRAGFWINSGPQNGSSLEPQFNQFAGTIQVLKAVGNHMVLVFCHQLPDRLLYSVLLSRVPKLSKQEIHSVHNLLNRKGLSTNSVKKVCAHNSAVNISSFKIFSMIVPFIFLKFLCT